MENAQATIRDLQGNVDVLTAQEQKSTQLLEDKVAQIERQDNATKESTVQLAQIASEIDELKRELAVSEDELTKERVQNGSMTDKLGAASAEIKELKAQLHSSQQKLTKKMTDMEQEGGELQVMAEKWTTSEKELMEVKLQRDSFQLERDRASEQLQQAIAGNEQMQELVQVMEEKAKQIDGLKADLERATFAQKSESVDFFKRKAFQTEQQRRQQEDESAKKLQALHRGKKGRARAEVVKTKGLGALNSKERDEQEHLRVQQEKTEEEAMRMRAKFRAEQEAAKEIADHRCWMRLNFLINRIVFKTSPNSANDLVERIMQVKAGVWANRFMNG